MSHVLILFNDFEYNQKFCCTNKDIEIPFLFQIEKNFAN